MTLLVRATRGRALPRDDGAWHALTAVELLLFEDVLRLLHIVDFNAQLVGANRPKRGRQDLITENRVDVRLHAGGLGRKLHVSDAFKRIRMSLELLLEQG